MNANTPRTILIAIRDETSGPMVVARALKAATSTADRFILLHVTRMARLKRVAELLTPQWIQPDAQGTPDPGAWLARLSAPLVAAGRDVRVEVRDGEPAACVIALAKETAADLILVATPREERIRELFLGSTVLAILRGAPCPVLVARGGTAPASGKVMAAIVPDEAGRRVAAATRDWFASAGITFVHSLRLPEEGQMRLQGYREDAISAMRVAMTKDMEAQFDFYRGAYPGATVRIEVGFPASTLLDIAMTMKPDAVVIGAHSGSRTEERYLGSVAQFMIYNCPFDVLLVP